MKSYLLAGLLALASTASFEAAASSATFLGAGTGPGGVSVAASATFDFSGDVLTVTLRNTSVANSGADVPGSTLTGVFWNSVSNRVLTAKSATLAAGSTIVNAAACNNPLLCATTTNVGGEFGYQATSLPGGADRGIASSGYLNTGLAGNVGNFNNGAAGVNLDDPYSLDGINFGIISAASGFNPNGGLESVPLIKDAVVFMLTGVSGLTISDITNISFQYGTALTELNIPCTSSTGGSCGGGGGGGGGNVPEPGTAALLGLALFGLASTRRRQSV